MGVYVLQKCAVSLDGYVNDGSRVRLLISNEEDFDRADAARAECDAILVGAGTIRSDDPWLLVRSEQRKKERALGGRNEQPIKVTLTESGNLDPAAHFFSAGENIKMVFCPKKIEAALSQKLNGLAEVIAAGEEQVDLAGLLRELESRGVHRLLIEAGNTIGTAFLEKGLVDELQVSIAPFFVGNSTAARFIGEGDFYHTQEHRMELKDVEKIGDMAMLTYILKRLDHAGS